MTVGWVAASTRGGALVRRLLGQEGARELAAAPTWAEARAQLAASFYGTEMPLDADRVTARKAATEAMIWQLRVLAGWLPVASSGLARLFAAPIEIANIESHLAELNGGPAVPAVPLGSLAVAWPRVSAASSPQRVRQVLTHSIWGDPGGSETVAVSVWLRVAWARRLIRQFPDFAEWAKGGLAVLLAREIFAFERDPAEATGRELDRFLGARWKQASTVSELADLLPESAAWPLRDVAAPADLWQAELAVIRRVNAEATTLAASRRFTKSTVAAIMSLLLLDLWRVTAAIEVVGRGPDPTAVIDAVA